MYILENEKEPIVPPYFNLSPIMEIILWTFGFLIAVAVILLVATWFWLQLGTPQQREKATDSETESH